jgi:fibronectin type 3 domain-containing protein
VGAVQIGVVPAVDNNIPPLPITQWLDGSALPGITSQYYVIATNVCGVSDTPVLTAFGSTGKLNKPTGVLLTQGQGIANPGTPSCGEILLQWNSVSRADGYEVWRSTNPNFESPTVTPESLGVTRDISFVDTPPVPGLLYYYWISSISDACTIVGDLPEAIDLSTILFGSSLPELVQPTNLIATKSTLCDRIRITWEGSFDGTDYKVYRHTEDDFNDAPVEIGTIDDLGYFDDPQNATAGDPLVPGTPYYYWVVAENDCGETSESNSDVGSLASPILAPAGLTATSGTACDTVRVNWLPRVLANSYRIYRDIDDNPSGASLLDDIQSSMWSFDDDTAVPGVMYYYWVEAVNICSTGTPVLQAVAADGMSGNMVGPSGMNATGGTNCGYVEVSWDNMPLANNYVVWRSETNDFATATAFDGTSSNVYQDETVEDKTLYFYWVTSDSQFCVGEDESAGVSGWAVADLAVVTGVSAGQGSECTGLLVVWDAVTNPLSYDLYRNTTGVLPGDHVGVDLTDPLYTDNDALVPGTEYYYWVEATTSCGTGPLSDFSRGYLAEDLDAPQGLGQVNSQNCSSITLEWQPVVGVNEYWLYRATNDEFTESTLLAPNITETTYSDATVIDGQTYYYWVKSNNACGASTESLSVDAANITLDSAPIETVSNTECGVVNITWTSVSGADEYHVYSSENPDPQIPSAANFIGSTTSTFFTDASPISDTPLYYWVRSVVDPDELNCVSDWGQSGLGLALAPAATPQNVVAGIEEQCAEIHLVWTVGNNANSSYHILRNDSNDDGTATEIGTTSSTTFIDDGNVEAIVPGAVYYYWVYADTSCGESGNSDVAIGQTQITPVAPSFVNATDSGTSSFCNSVEITWHPEATADNYTVWRSTGLIGESVPLEETPNTFFEDITAEPGVVYTYWVTSTNACASSDIALADSNVGSIGELLAPTTVSASDSTASCGQIDLTWDEVTLAFGYLIYRSETPTFTDAVLVDSSDGPAWTDFDPPSYDTQLYYFVSSLAICNDASNLPTLHSPAESGIATAAPITPIDVLATVGTACEQIIVEWTGAPSDQDYDIYRNTSGVLPTVGGADLYVSNFPASPYVDAVGADTTQYHYWVLARSSCPELSNLSVSATGVAATDILELPTLVATQGTTCLAVDVSWNEVATATKYHVYRNEVEGDAGAQEQAFVIAGTSTWQDTTALPGETYFYWVAAENDCGETPLSGNGLEGWSGESLAPTLVTASEDLCGFTTIGWSTVDGADAYSVYRNQANDWASSTFVEETNETTIDDVGALAGVPYYYWVTSESFNCGPSTPSTAVIGAMSQGVEVPSSTNATYRTYCSDVVVSWSHPGNGTTFTVKRSLPDGSDEQTISAGSSSQQFIDTPPLSDTSYSYWVEANNGCGDSDASESVLGQSVGAVSATTGLSASDGLGCLSVSLTWSPVNSASGYNVYRSTSDDIVSAGAPIGVTAQDTVTFEDFTASNGVTYYYWVLAQNECGERIYDILVDENDVGFTGTLDNPTGVTTSNDPDEVQCGHVLITWDSVVGNTGYKVYRSVDPNAINPGLIGDAPTISFVDTTADPKVPYYYFVGTDNNGCLDIPSNSEQGMAFPFASAVQNVFATNDSCSFINLSWTAEPWAAEYSITRGTTNDFDSWPVLESTFESTYVDNNVAANTQYYYWVTTTHPSCDDSPASDVATASTTVPVVGDVDATVGECDRVEVSWTSVIGEATYHVYRNTIDNPTGATEIGTELGSPFNDNSGVSGTQYYYWVSAELSACAGEEGEFGSVAIGQSVPLLSTPDNVAATQGTLCGEIFVQWTANEHAVAFDIYRSENSDWDTAALLGTANAPASSYSDIAALGGVTYNYWVVANNSCGSSPTVTADGVTGFNGELANPLLTASSDLCGVVALSWSSVASADSYSLTQSTYDDFATSTVIYTGSDTYYELAAIPDQQFYYWVQTVNNNCVTDAGSSTSGIALAITETPANVQASADTLCGAIEVTWDTSGQQAATTYRVYRAETNSFTASALVETTNDTTFLDELVVAGVPYYYWVTGENSCSTSLESIVASGIPGEAAIPPTNVQASDSGESWFCNEVVIAWLASEGAESYKVYRSETGNAAEAELIAEGLTVPNHLDSGASPLIVYTYWVVAVTSCGPHAIAEANSNTGSVGQLPPPDDLDVDPNSSCGSIGLTWTPVSGATGYAVYRSSVPTYPGAEGLIGLAQGDSFVDTNFVADQYDVTQYYWLTSLSEFCNNPDVFSTPPVGGAALPPLTIPEGLDASNGTVCNQIWLQWVATPNAISYEIWRNDVESPLVADGAVLVGEPTTNFFADTVTSGTWYYWLKAINTCGTTTYSEGVSGYSAEDIASPVISATQGTTCNAITLNWATVTSADRYFVHRSLNDDGSDIQNVGEVISPTTTWFDLNADPGRTYYYWVTSQNDCGTSTLLADGQSGWLGELPAPTNVLASDSEFCGGIVITWDEVNNAVDYNVYKKQVGSDDDPTFIGSSNGATTFTDFAVSASDQYYYWVKSLNNNLCGESDFSSTDIGQSLPPVVTPVSVTATYNEQCEQITIAWEHNELLTTYKLYRSTVNDVDSADEIQTEISDTQFIDDALATVFGLVPGIDYYYWVKADNQCGESTFSNPGALGLATDSIITAPDEVYASSTCETIILNWSAVEGANKYQVTKYIDNTPGAPGSLIYEGGQTLLSDSDVESGLTYYYEVAAVNACTISDVTDLVDSSPSAPAPPTQVNATDSSANCQVTVTWVWPVDAPDASFRIYRGIDADPSNALPVGDTSSTTWVDVTPLSTAYYFVRALTIDCGESAYSTGDIGSPDQGLASPPNVIASNGTNCLGVEITWDPVAGADSYCVYRSVSSGPNTAAQLVCGVETTNWLDTTALDTTYWYWVTSVQGSGESCSLGFPDQGWPSDSLGEISNLDATICTPNYVTVTWVGTDLCYDVARTVMPQTPTSFNIIAECAQSPYIDSENSSGTYYYYVRPVNACGAVGDWEGPTIGSPSSCFGDDLPEGLLGDAPGDPTILIVPRDLSEGGEGRRSTNGRIGTDARGGPETVEGSFDSMPPWSLCLVGDAEITTDPALILGDSRWSLPLGGSWRLVGHEGYADLFFLGGSDWEHVRSLRVKEIESGVAQTLLSDGIAAVVGTVPEAGSNVLITGVSPEDCDKDGVPDGCEILLGLSLDMNIDGIPDSCAADLTGDGVVDSADLIEVLQNFGISINGFGDVTGDGIVDQSDVLSILMSM